MEEPAARRGIAARSFLRSITDKQSLPPEIRQLFGISFQNAWRRLPNKSKKF
jgi:hypothetical protein